MKRSQGDQVRSAFDLLVFEHHVQVRAFGRSLGVEPEWVDDIAQEAFLTAYRDWKTFDPRGFGKWLRGIAANSVRDELGKNARRQQFSNLHRLSCSSSRNSVQRYSVMIF